jgi:two-component system, response regulator
MNNKVIMLVEDNPDDVMLCKQALKNNRVEQQLLVARDGVEAVDFLTGKSGLNGVLNTCMPALVFLDLKLPKMDGLEVLRQLRANNRTRLLIVIILSCSTEEKDVQESFRRGANSYLRKPVDFVEFSNMLRDAIHYWLDMNIQPSQENY